MGIFGLEPEQKATGFASPAQGYEGRTFDFNRMLVTNPPATFIMRMESGEMSDWGIVKGSLLVVDRSLKPRDRSIVIVAHAGHFLCREAVFTKREAVFRSGEGEMKAPHGTYEIFGVAKTAVTTL